MPIPDLQLQLARKSFRTFGYASFEEELLNQQQIQKIQSSFNPFEMKLPSESEIGGIQCGKEFGLVHTINGKVYYYGKSAALGLISIGKTPSMKPIELIVAKTSNIVHVAIGHDGIHAILVNDDGNVYFTGTARRGEDGDTSKNRRERPKAVKPKKITKTESHFIVHASCNYGTSALVTNTGQLIMLGKDTIHCDASGYVTDILDQHITKVALGKAHCVALNSKGQIFSFGMNNKGQCGRFKGKASTAPFAQDSDMKQASSSMTDSDKDIGGNKFDATVMCDFDDHNVVHGQCRVCTVCRECTGYNVSCVTTQNTSVENRVAGT